MKFTRIEGAIKSCKKHLVDTNTAHTDIASHLAGYLVVFISAEFELRIKALIEARAARSKDAHIRNFVTRASRRIVRGPKIDQLVGILGYFDDKFPSTFHGTVGDQAKAAYDSIIINRHSFVHNATCSATINDVETFFNNSQGVFSAMVAALGLKASEISHLH
jgi:hypothetical protein